MSKRRQDVDLSHVDDELSSLQQPDLVGWVCFTQLKKDGPFVYAGWLDAADREMALLLAREHYGQDQVCTALHVAPREYVGGLRENADGAREQVDSQRAYQIYTQASAGDAYLSSEIIEARSAQQAIDAARASIAADANHIWAIPVAAIATTDPSDVIWRMTDQSYRMARGYSKAVRQKWEVIRAERDLHEYERDDLQDTF
ncbi:MAG: hypothetical protein ACR2GY_08835 [Phycisphaerales bacterium]